MVNASNAEESSAASEELATQSTELRRLVEAFKINKQYETSVNQDYSKPVKKEEPVSARSSQYKPESSKESTSPEEIIRLDDDFTRF